MIPSSPHIGLAALADHLPQPALSQSIAQLQAAGLKVRLAHNLSHTYGRMAGDDPTRAAALMELAINPEVTAVLMVAGGYGSIRTLPFILWHNLNPLQPWIGFSDITSALNARVAQTGTLGGWHAPMAKHLTAGFADQNTSHLLNILKGHPPQAYGPTELAGTKILATGTASGRLLGGNLAVFCSLLGTPYAPQPQPGDVLFIEDINETNYRIDRNLEQLFQAGWFDQLGGLIFGNFIDVQDSTSRPFGFAFEDILARHAARIKGPVLANFPAGHSGPNLPLPIGGRVTLKVGTEIALKFS